jgi:hypothetical protein
MHTTIRPGQVQQGRGRAAVRQAGTLAQIERDNRLKYFIRKL